MEKEEKRLSILVTGRVQGVGYRFFAKEAADMYGISGWVRNCFNGSVELEAQGINELLLQFLKELKKGPMMGHVSDIQSREIVPVEGEKLFSVRY